ncbi:MAG: site-specific DNA-methyltransferase, partial [Thaumarchaeota archaeon]|nr:site-specific DNA-methyltransferase [Nitrososphaerota archaeon]
GIDAMPVGNIMAQVICSVANNLHAKNIIKYADGLLDYIQNGMNHSAFIHVRITRYAFPSDTELELAKAKAFINKIRNPDIRLLLNFMCMSVLEDVSYTRKDGQFLRWDARSGRSTSDRLQKGSLLTLSDAISRKLHDVIYDLPYLKQAYHGSNPNLITDSCLVQLKKFKNKAFDTVITSPPYANRYDYTRTYALELAYLGYDFNGFNNLRQKMLTSTVENHSKVDLLTSVYGRSRRLTDAIKMADNSTLLQNILKHLKKEIKSLNNPNIIRMVENYFIEMALVIKEFERLVKSGGNVFMVNDNVRYNGKEIPTDIILSDFAEHSGFVCESIRILKRGKGNSSQQMGAFGKKEMRKCVYHWRKR